MQLPFRKCEMFDFEKKYLGTPLCFEEKSGLVFLDIHSVYRREGQRGKCNYRTNKSKCLIFK